MESQAKYDKENGPLGATGRFPGGKLNQSDEGELKLAVSTIDNNIILRFGKQVAWLGLSKKEAMELGRVLIDRANKII